MSKSYGNLIHLIIERSNMEDAFDEVVGDLGEERRKKYGAKKERRERGFKPLLSVSV